VKKTLVYILIFCHVIFSWNLWVVYGAIWDIGHWRDGAWSQIPGTTFWGFNFNTEIRNDGIYTKPNDSTIQVSEAGDYLIIGTTHDEDASNGRYNSQLRVSQIAGTGDIFSSHYTGYSRDNSENESWTRALWVVIWASANSQFQVQKRRDTDAPTWWSVINSSDLQVIKLDQTNYGIYGIWWTWNSYWWTTPNTVDIDSIVSQSNISAIEGDTVWNTITLKWNDKKYLIAWSVSFNTWGARTQRVGHLEYDNVDKLSTRSYCYQRNGTNEYCGLGSMDIIQTWLTDISVKSEVFRGSWVWVDQWWADVDGSAVTDWNGQMIVLEMPDSLEIFSSEDSVGLQEISSAQTLNIARDVNTSNNSSFSENTNSLVNISKPADIFSWANIWTARSDVTAGQRLTSYGSITIDGVEQTIGQHWNYSRWNQATTDTFAMWFQPAGIYTTTGPWSTIWVNSTPLAGGEAWWWDRTQAGTLGFYALNLNTLLPTPGWVYTDLALWLKADEGTSTTTDGTWLTNWIDQSWNGLDATAVNAPTYRNNSTDELNYNPVIDFDGVNDYMRNLANWAHSDTYYIVIVPDVDIEWTASQGVPFSFDCESWILSAWWPCGLPFGGVALGAFTLTIPDEVITHAIGSSANYRSSKTAVITYPAWKPLLIGVNDNAASSITNIYEKWEQIDNETRNAYQTVTNTDYGLWRSMDDANPFLFDGKIAEVINYDWGLTITERQKIESYLAIKYGITLNNGTQDYIASNGTTTFWSTAINTGYNNNIFWIWRDNLQALWQIKSKSINDWGVVTIEAQWEGTNTANSFVDMSNNEFFMSWDNLGWNSWSAIDAPVWYNILSRIWKVQETGDVWNIRASFDVEDSNFNIPNLTAWINYFFVFDSDGDWNLSNETPSIMTNTTGTIWESNSVNISDGQIYTIATLASSNNIPTDISISATDINENVANGTLLATLTTTDADPLDTHTYSFVPGLWDTDNNRFTISWSSINLNHSPDHEIQDLYNIRIQTDDGNGWVYQETFTITVNDLGESITSTIDLENIEDEDKYNVWSGQWNNNTVNPNTGTNALESNNLGLNNTQSCFQVEHDSATDGFVEFDYNVSSQAGSDELRFFIDNVQQNQWSGTVPYTTFTSALQTAWPHTYKWCYVKDWAGSAGTDNAYIDNINFINGVVDVNPPVINSTNFASGSILPGGNHDIIINYSDTDSGIDSASSTLELYKWDGVSSYGSNIAGWNISLNSASVSSASYSMNDLSFGRYQYRFTISDNNGNSVLYIHDFYIDEPEFLVGSGSIDIGTLSSLTNTFSETVTLTVRTVGAGFDISMNRSTPFTDGTEEIPSYDGTTGYGYQQTPYDWNILTIGTSENIATQATNINTNWFKNTYTFDIQIWALIDNQQIASDYIGDLDFTINLDY